MPSPLAGGAGVAPTPPVRDASYVCVCVCVCLCTFTHTHAHTHPHMCVCWVCMHRQTQYPHVGACVHACMFVCVHVDACVYACMLMCVHLGVRVRVCVHVGVRGDVGRNGRMISVGVTHARAHAHVFS